MTHTKRAGTKQITPRTKRSVSIRFQKVVLRGLTRILLACLGTAFPNLLGYGVDQPLEKEPGNVVKSGDASVDRSQEAGLVGYWKLRGDCRDYSGHNNNGVNHGVNLDTGAFDGRGAYVEVPSNASLKFGTGDFALCVWIYTEKELDDVVGDVVDMYDPSLRRGITLCVYTYRP